MERKEQESDGLQRQIELLSLTQYQDLDYTSGYGQRIIGLGEIIVAFMSDAIYIGTAK